ncbi:hypothetical protein BDA96_05G209200 [Sorghum bicolor]|uniref:Uncharacterized protein n=2 Tax=Sorghum bicolor TaxID=4558 RepID=A0A921QYH2_SORBI|nr:hypothetical protein BDA96_05G209200 [Sorghum bicolor]OQU83877.1 hypothetical protein SORBI_3005G192500 [Sorghum bicolor]
MAFIVLLAAAAAVIAFVLHLATKNHRSHPTYSLPPGNLGIPVIGQTFSLLHALRTNTDDRWFRARIKRYGPVSKMSVLGSPTVLLAGTAANHFIFTNEDLILTQTRALRSLLRRSILTLTGDKLKQVRSALQGYLRPEMVRRYVGKMDIEVRRQLKLNWVGRSTVNVLPMARNLTLGVICSVVFGEEAATIVDALGTDFQLLEQDEIANKKGTDGALTWEHVSSMKYTWRVALETLRTVPPVFGSFRTATKDIEYQGYHIPKGWKVFAAQSITHMDSRFFTEPTKFDPSRFEKRSSIPPYSFLPFGGGPRMCPRTEFSRVETMVAMHYLVTQFRWKLCFKDEAYKKDPKPTPVFGCPVELELREPYNDL